MYRFNLLEVPTSQTESDHQEFLTRGTFWAHVQLLEVPYRAVPRSLEVGGQDIVNGENKCAKRAK